MIDESMIRLIKAMIKEELKSSRLKVSEMTGSGGDTTIGSDGDIQLRTKVGKKAYYNGVEIGSGVAGTYLPLAGGNMTGPIYMGSSGKIQMDYATAIKFYNTAGGGNLAGEIVAFNGTYYYDFVVRAGGVLHLEGTTIKLNSPLGANLDMGTYQITSIGAPTLATHVARYKDAIIVCTSTTRPASPTEGMHIYETDTDKDYTCTVGGATPTWIERGGFANWVTPKLFLNNIQSAWITMNGDIMEFHIPGGKWRVVPI